ncbi:ice-binding family protein [Flavobacterium sp.]|uniref:ice-binding family protein n=1 Tax=Flavobacterium sp. TaxID=239 RepID=UPI003750635E
MKTKLYPILIIIVLICSNAKAQVGIGTTTPDISSILDIHSIDKGVLFPRLSTTERDEITAPASGLFLFNTTTGLFNYYNSGWKSFSSGIISPSNGGTGIANNNAATLTFPASFPISITATSTTAVTLPTSGKLFGTATASITSGEVLNSVTDKTGTGTLVFSTTPIFTGIPQVPTATTSTNTNQIASTKFVMDNTDKYNSINDNLIISTTSTTDEVISGMTISPSAGTYLVMFNSQYNINAVNTSNNAPTIDTAQCLNDLQSAYSTLMITTTTNSTHTPAFGGGETLYPGVYAIGAASSIAGTLILDAQGNSNAVFIFKINGAFSTGASSTVVLTNGASACNIFWVAEGAISIGATSVVKGTFIANSGAVFMGANCSLVGRLFSITGAVNFGPGTMLFPENCNYLNLGLLTDFVAFTGTGAVGNTGNTTITGNIGSNNGAITGFESAALNGIICSPSNSSEYSNDTAMATFSIYQNGVLVANSNRTRKSSVKSGDISLQAIATVTSGQTIDVRWKIDGGNLNVENKILTLINVK